MILRGDMTWFSSSSWSRKQAYMYISELGLTYVENGILGENHLLNLQKPLL